MTVSPAEVKCGQPYTVNVKITNTGGSDVTLSDGEIIQWDFRHRLV